MALDASLAQRAADLVPLAALPIALLVVVCVAWWHKAKMTQRPRVVCQPTAFNRSVLSRMPTIRALFRPMLFLTNGHVETIFAAKARSKWLLRYRREYLLVPEGGIVALDWKAHDPDAEVLPDDAPVVILLPGLTGGSDDTYVRYAVRYAEEHGVRAVVFNSRGCGDTTLTTPQFYSSLFIGDLEAVVAHVAELYPHSVLFATGWSLGANILVNYLGTVGRNTPLSAAASLCNPFNLTIGIGELERGFNKLYDVNLAKAMGGMVQRNAKVWHNAGPEFKMDIAAKSPSVRAWDDAITRVSFGFDSVEDYYAAGGSHQRVHNVQIPLLCVQAEDDPIAPIRATPEQALHDNPNCILAVTKTGGHLGWISEDGGYTGEPWTDLLIVEWLLAVQLQLRQATQPPTPLTPTPARSTSDSAPDYLPRLATSVHARSGAVREPQVAANGVDATPALRGALFGDGSDDAAEGVGRDTRNGEGELLKCFSKPMPPGALRSMQHDVRVMRIGDTLSGAAAQSAERDSTPLPTLHSSSHLHSHEAARGSETAKLHSRPLALASASERCAEAAQSNAANAAAAKNGAAVQHVTTGASSTPAECVMRSETQDSPYQQPHTPEGLPAMSHESESSAASSSAGNPTSFSDGGCGGSRPTATIDSATASHGAQPARMEVRRLRAESVGTSCQTTAQDHFAGCGTVQFRGSHVDDVEDASAEMERQVRRRPGWQPSTDTDVLPAVMEPGQRWHSRGRQLGYVGTNTARSADKGVRAAPAQAESDRLLHAQASAAQAGKGSGQRTAPSAPTASPGLWWSS